MDFSIQNWILNGYDELTQLKMFSVAGFKYLDWNFCDYASKTTFSSDSMDETIAFYKNFKSICDSKGIKVAHTHSIFPTYMDESNRDKMLFLLEKCYAATNVLGSNLTVVHPMMTRKWEGEENRELRIKENVDFYNTLAKFGRKYNVITCIENMFGSSPKYGIYKETSCSRYEEMVEIYQKIDDKEMFAFCFDSGHANMLYKDKAVDMIDALGENIKVIHLHDNNDKIDFHRPPKHGNTDWTKIFAELKKVNFSGIYNFELSPISLSVFNKQSKLNKLYKELNSFLEEYSQN